MIDPITASMTALTSHSPAAIALLFFAGVLTSVGPCIAPRYIAIAAIINGSTRPLIPTLAFVLGLVGAFIAIGFGAGLLGTLQSVSSAVYVVLAIGLIAGGCLTLIRAVPHASAPEAHACAEQSAIHAAHRSFGAIFLLGAASALVVSPCCTPIVAAIVTTSTAIGKPLVGAGLLASYAAGHALPLFFAGNIGARVRGLLPNVATSQAPAIVSAVLMLALGTFYAVLA